MELEERISLLEEALHDARNRNIEMHEICRDALYIISSTLDRHEAAIRCAAESNALGVESYLND